jgi:peptidoglycan hydrolase CwlO-like protein
MKKLLPAILIIIISTALSTIINYSCLSGHKTPKLLLFEEIPPSQSTNPSVDELKEKIANLESKIDDLESTVNDSGDTHYASTSSVDDVESDISILYSRTSGISKLERKIDDLETQISNLNSRLSYR